MMQAYAVYTDYAVKLPKEYGEKSLMELGFPCEGLCYILHTNSPTPFLFSDVKEGMK